jgi:hypothetical protein
MREGYTHPAAFLKRFNPSHPPCRGGDRCWWIGFKYAAVLDSAPPVFAPQKGILKRSNNLAFGLRVLEY